MSENSMISTFVFLDIETTELPSPGKKPAITEICFIAVHRMSLLDGDNPRVLNKVNLCINPMKPVSPTASSLTGLYNDNLEHQKDFDHDLADLLTSFIKRLEPPVCLLAHNGNRFDFTLLHAELASIGKSLPDILMCADTLDAFRALDGLGPLGQQPQPIHQAVLDRLNNASTTPSTREHCSPSVLPENMAKVNLPDFVSKQNNNVSANVNGPKRNISEVENVKRKLFTMNDEGDESSKRHKCVDFLISGDRVEVDKVKRKLFCDGIVNKDNASCAANVNGIKQPSSSVIVTGTVRDSPAAGVNMQSVTDNKLPTIEESDNESKCDPQTANSQVKTTQKLDPISAVPPDTSSATCGLSTEQPCAQTPIGNKVPNDSTSPTRSIFPTPNSTAKRRVSYSLREIHKRIMAHYPPDSHFAESDCVALLNVVHKKSSELLCWFDKNSVPFNSVGFMFTPKPRKCLDAGVFPNH